MADEEKQPAFELDLEKPVLSYGTEVTRIVLRIPTGKDVIECGNPVLFDPSKSTDNVIRFDERKGAMMIAALAGMPLSSVAQMTSNDFMSCLWGISGFFYPRRNSA